MKREEKNTRAMTTRHRRVLNKTFITECVLALKRYERTNERTSERQSSARRHGTEFIAMSTDSLLA